MIDDDCFDCEEHFEERAVDNSAWDGGAAMARCTNSDTPASCFGSICAGRKSGEPSERQSWALPHHKTAGGPPNAAGVRNALARLSQTQGLTNTEEARRHLERHMASIQAQSASAKMPRDGLVRALAPAMHPVVYRDADDDERPTLFGHFARFDEWTEIDSAFEGHFLERIAPGAFTKTFTENRANMRPLFQHGKDPQLGDKVIGAIRDLREDEEGAYYEVGLFDGLPELVMSGLRENQYGASFRFRVLREDIERDPERTDHNPDGLPERTIREAHVMEFGPVTFPAYAGATAGVRSMTDEFSGVADDPTRLASIIEYARTTAEPEAVTHNITTVPEPPAPSEPDAADSTSEPERREEEPEPQAMKGGEMNHEDDKKTLEELQVEVKALHADMEARAAEYGTRVLSEEEQSRWDADLARRRALEERIAKAEQRRREVEEFARVERLREPGFETKTYGYVPDQDRSEDIYDLSTIRTDASNPEDAARKLRDRAMRAVERGSYSEEISKEDAQTKVAGLLDHKDTPDAKLARRILLTGHPTYQRAFWKTVANHGLSTSERQVFERAMTAATEGAIAVPFELDPTVILASNGVVNPIRQVARVESIVGETWKGITTLGVTAAYAAEATEASDNSPTLVQPEVTAIRAQAFIPFSVELGQDWGSLRAEMTSVLVDSKDVLEANQFANGTGSPNPTGFMVAGTNTTKAAGSAAFAVADLYTLEEDLPPRFRSRARFVGNKFTFNKVRQFDTAGGASLWVQLAYDQPPSLIGYPAHELSTMPAALTSGTKILALGDWSKFLIVDRVGMDVELIPHLFGGSNNYPTGQRGFYALWRNNCVLLQANALRILYTGP